MTTNVLAQLTHLGIPTSSVSGALQRVRTIITGKPDHIRGAESLVGDILGIKPSFADINVARIATFGIIETIVNANGVIDNAEEIVVASIKRANDFIDNPSNAWMFAKNTTTKQDDSVVTEIAGGEASVKVNKDGNIKRGSKEPAAYALYVTHIGNSETPMSSADFIQLLIKELDMSKLGARTYLYNAKKKFEASK